MDFNKTEAEIEEDKKNAELAKILKPDYSSEMYDSDDDDDDFDDDEEDDDSISSVDEGKEEDEEDDDKRIVNNINGFNNNNRFMVTTVSTPFGTTPSTPTWGAAGNSWNNSSSSGNNAWSQVQQQPVNKPAWGSSSSSTGWGSGSYSNNSNKIEIDRNKKVVIADFQDIIAETMQSNGNIGFVPRGIYDLRPKIDVWTRISAYNPEKIYILCRNYGGDRNLWNSAFSYYCMALSSFLGFSHLACQAIVMSDGVTKSDHINFILNNPEFPICKKDAVYIGVNSGFAGQSNLDRSAAELCGIDYVDATQLLSNMY